MAYELIFAPTQNETHILTAGQRVPTSILLAKGAVWATCQREGDEFSFYGYYCENDDSEDEELCHRIVARLGAGQCNLSKHDNLASASDAVILAQAEIKATFTQGDIIMTSCPPGQYYGKDLSIRHIADPPTYDVQQKLDQNFTSALSMN